MLIILDYEKPGIWGIPHSGKVRRKSETSLGEEVIVKATGHLGLMMGKEDT